VPGPPAGRAVRSGADETELRARGARRKAALECGRRAGRDARLLPQRASPLPSGADRGIWQSRVLTSTASQPSSMARVASEAVPIPASSTTGTGLREQISSIAAGFAIPIPEPISDPPAASPPHIRHRPVSGRSPGPRCNREARLKPLRTNSSAARTSCSTSGVERLAVADQL